MAAVVPVVRHALWVGCGRDPRRGITAMCTNRDTVGHTLVVCGHDDGSVSIWRLDNRARLLYYRRPGETVRVESLAVADCQSEQIVVGVWASGSVWAFRQATGETTGHWGRTIERGHRRWPTNIVTVDDDGTQLAAVADDTELLLFKPDAGCWHPPTRTRRSLRSTPSR